MWRGINFPWLWTLGTPPPVPTIRQGSGLLHIGIEYIILQTTDFELEGNIFALPAARRVNLSWQVQSFAITTCELWGSLDQQNFILLDTVANSSSLRIVNHNVTSVKVIMTDNPTNALVTVRIKTSRGTM